MYSNSKKSVDNERRGRFNAIDFFLIAVFLVAVAVFIYVMFFSDADLFGFSEDQRNSKDVLIAFEVEVDDDLLNRDGELQFSVGDKFMSSDGGNTIGKISEISSKSPLMVSTGEYTVGEDGAQVLVYAEYPGKGIYTVTVLAEASVRDGTYIVGGNPVRISESFGFTTTYFTGVCRCISIQEVASDE